MGRDHLRRFGDWLAFQSLGQGGQGEVFLVRRIPQADIAAVNTAIREAASHVRYNAEGLKRTAAEEILLAAHNLLLSRVGALKVLHSPDKAKNPVTSEERFRREIAVLAKLNHPSLIRLLDSNLEERWLVMEYHPRGTLTMNSERYKADPLHAIAALRPLVGGVAAIHDQNLIHRDIKPENIFVADDDRLVLGDWGLAFDTSGDEARLTTTNENVGSWQWMPPWAHGARVEDLDPSFDTFSLGKVLWAMISGRKFLRLHYYDDPQFNLELLFPDDPRMEIVNRFLFLCLADRQGQGIPSATAMLDKLDNLSRELQPLAKTGNGNPDQLPRSPIKPKRIMVNGYPLSEAASEIIHEASMDKSGQVFWSRSLDSTGIQTNGKNLIPEPKDPRTVARFEAAVEELVRAKCLKQVGDHIWQVTDDGFRTADAMAGS